MSPKFCFFLLCASTLFNFIGATSIGKSLPKLIDLPNKLSADAGPEQLLTIEDIRASTNTEELTKSEPCWELKNIVLNRLNFSTPENGTVFWSGENRPYAEKWAKKTGRKTLELTDGGAYLDGLDIWNCRGTYGQNAPIPPAQSGQIWDLASTKFASMACGKAFSFTSGIQAENPKFHTVRTWFRLELPILLDSNENVNEIVWMSKEAIGNGIFIKMRQFLDNTKSNVE